MKKNKILIVDDNKLNRQSLADIFRKAYQIVESEDGKKALEYLKKDKGLSVAAIILDLIMPVMDGFAFLEEFKKHSEYKYIPIVIATTEDNVENEKRCLEYGVWDFIPKSFHREIIWFRVMNAIKRSKQHFLEYDSLTGIYNRQMFYQKTREMLDDSKDETFAFIRLDIDRFKMINSFYGAAEGDRLLRCMAHNICGVLSAYKTYTYGRLNSDVFGICVAVEKEQDALLIAQKIREQVKKNGELRCYLETSAGCYIIRDKEMEVSAIYDHAVIAAQESKGKYMHHESLYTEQMGKEMQREQHIIKLDYYVWDQVCQLIATALRAGRKPDPISVNVSRVNLYNPNFLESLVNLVEKYRIPPEYLHLELTESVFSDTENVILNAVNYLHKAGFTILMDDFGSGYSSLNVLKDIDLDVLKIDMKFLSKGTDDGRGEKILAAVIQMAKALDMPVIAEGVEEKKQVQMLKRLGCNYIQGYYFAKPMPQEDYERLARKSHE